MKSQNNTASIVSLVLILLTTAYGFRSLMPSAIENAVLSETEFSTAKAMRHVKMISQKPHYVGSDAHDEVRDYILSQLEKLGLEPAIQEEVVFRTDRRRGCRVQNIYAKIKGTEPGKALLLMSHYDSAVHASYGASDAGSGVATLLEGIRAFLAKGIQPKNDIIILITDAEELALLGAQAFADKHPWAKDVVLALNFEARGSGGPGIMLLETNQGNRGLIENFNTAKPSHPVANSFMYSIYKIMPNDMDLTILRRSLNIIGFNFAFIDDHFDYHTAQDTYDRIDPGSLKHQGSYLTALLGHFSQSDLNTVTSDQDLVYFNFPFLGLISYPFQWGLPFLIGAFILLIIAIGIGLKRKKIHIKAIFQGFVPLLISLILVSLFSFYGWKLILVLHPEYLEIQQGFPYNGHYYITAFISISLWISILIYRKFLADDKLLSFYIAPILIWLIVNAIILAYLPGGAYFILAPLLSLIVLLFLILSDPKNNSRLLIATFILLPIILVFAPVAQLFPIALGLKMVVIAAVFSILILYSFLPIVFSIKGIGNLNKLFLIVSILSFGSAWFSSSFSDKNKKPNSISYGYLTEERKAFWLSYDHQIDPFTEQFLGDDYQLGGVQSKTHSLGLFSSATMHREASPIRLNPTDIIVVRDTIMEGYRQMTVKLNPNRKINRIDLITQNPIEILDLSVNEQQIVMEDVNSTLHLKKGQSLFQYFFTQADEALELVLTVQNDDDPTLILLEYSFDLLSSPLIRSLVPDLKSRDPWQMPKPFTPNDAILVKTEINF